MKISALLFNSFQLIRPIDFNSAQECIHLMRHTCFYWILVEFLFFMNILNGNIGHFLYSFQVI